MCFKPNCLVFCQSYYAKWNGPFRNEKNSMTVYAKIVNVNNSSWGLGKGLPWRWFAIDLEGNHQEFQDACPVPSSTYKEVQLSSCLLAPDTHTITQGTLPRQIIISFLLPDAFIKLKLP